MVWRVRFVTWGLLASFAAGAGSIDPLVPSGDNGLHVVQRHRVVAIEHPPIGPAVESGRDRQPGPKAGPVLEPDLKPEITRHDYNAPVTFDFENPIKVRNGWKAYGGTLHIPQGYGYGAHCVHDWPFTVSVVDGSGAKKLALRYHGATGGNGSMGSPPGPRRAGILVQTVDGDAFADCDREVWAALGLGQQDDELPYAVRRMHTILKAVANRWNIDLTQGVSCAGTSMGGAGCYWQSLFLPAPFGPAINEISMSIAPVDYADDEPPKFIGVHLLDTEAYMGSRRYQEIYRKESCSSNDLVSLGCAERSIIYESVKAPYNMRMYQNEHRSSPEPGVNIPNWSSRRGDLRSGPLIAFSRSTGNWPLLPEDRRDKATYPRMHANLGLLWNADTIEDEADRFAVQIRYEAQSRLTDEKFSPGLPDQPQEITVSVTPRRVVNFVSPEGGVVQWRFGDVTGEAVVTRGLITVDGLSLESGDEWQTLELSATPFDGLPALNRAPEGEPVEPRLSEQEPKSLRATWPYPASQQPPDIRWPIVFLVSDRSHIEHQDNKGAAISAEASSAADAMPEVGKPLTGFLVADLIYLGIDGVEKTLYACRDAVVPCSITDPAVSPDGHSILFAVHFGEAIQAIIKTTKGTRRVADHLKGIKRATIILHDLNTGETRPVLPVGTTEQPDGIIDAYPDWKSNSRIVFTSNRAKIAPVYTHGLHPAFYAEALQRHEMNIDGTGLVRTGPQDDVALSPHYLSNGLQIHAKWWADGYRRKKAIGGVSETIPNLFHLGVAKYNGDQEFVACCAHGATQRWADGRLRTKAAINNCIEIKPDVVACNHYYRNNKKSTGDIAIIDISARPFAVEGNDELVPEIDDLTIEHLFESRDITPVRYKGRLMGGVNWPAPTPLENNGMVFSWGKGLCFSNEKDENWNDEFLAGSPGCDWGIYFVEEVPVTDDVAFIKIVDRPDRHEFAARLVLSYQKLFGVHEPVSEVMPIDTDSSGMPFCSIKIANIRKAGLYQGKSNLKRYAGTKYHSFILPGYPTDGSATDAIAVYQALPNTRSQKEIGHDAVPEIGHFTTLLGYAIPEPDGSVWARVPCDTPYYLVAVAEDGTEYIHDQFKQKSTGPGEGRLCLGCHFGHNESEHRDPKAVFDASMAATRGPLPLAPSFGAGGNY